MRRSRILVVEDETIVALDLQSRLQTLGYDVPLTASSGEEALEHVDAMRPDLVLMDVNLAGTLDGVDTAIQVRNRRGVPVIFLTACQDDTTLERAKEAEPYGYLIKPFDDRELHSQIKMALHKSVKERELRESEERYSLAAAGTDDGLWDWDLRADRVYFSARWLDMLGYEEGDFDRPTEWFEKIHPGDQARVRQEIIRHFKNGTRHFRCEYRLLHKDDSYRWVLTRGTGQRDADGRVLRMAGSQTDITEQKLYDAQTGLPNRALFMDRLERALQRTRESKKNSVAVLALRIEDLDRVSDSVGSGGVGQLLDEVIQRIQGVMDDRSTLVSLGDEGLAILLEEVRVASDAMRLARRLQDAVKQQFELDGHMLYVNLSVGISLASDYHGPSDLLDDAQTAVHKAFQNGNGRCEIFDQGMRNQALQRLQLETRLRQAVENGDLLLYYQPIVSLRDGNLAGFEALVRWFDEEGRLVMPGDFIPVAEETGLIIPLERWVLKEACTQVKKWQEDRPNDPPTLSVNFSADQYCQPDVVEMVERTLKETGFNSDYLKLEITERTLLRNREEVRDALAKIQKLNIQLHMDDFGTGYSSLSYLHRFPIDVLKIDRSFVSNLEMNAGTRQIVKTIANLGQNLRMKVTAEGIESLQQLRELQLLDCDYGQGFFFSKPLDVRRATQLVRGEPSWKSAFQDASDFIGDDDSLLDKLREPSS